MKSLLVYEFGNPIHAVSISELKKNHMIDTKYVSFTNYNRMSFYIEFTDNRYEILCQNGIKNYKKTLKEVKKYIRDNIIESRF